MNDNMLDLSLNPVFVDASGNRVICGKVQPNGELAVRFVFTCCAEVETTVSRQWVSDAVQSGRLTYLGEQ